MGLITAVRSQVPAPAPVATAAPAGSAKGLVTQNAHPVAESQRKDAPQQPAAAAASVKARLAERDDSSHPASAARAAADAARDAYIRASIAAGYSPLPLPGL